VELGSGGIKTNAHKRAFKVPQNSKAEQLRDLLRLAKMLRQYVSDTCDTHYIELFLTAADALEKRAEYLASGKEASAPQHFDLLC